MGSRKLLMLPTEGGRKPMLVASTFRVTRVIFNNVVHHGLSQANRGRKHFPCDARDF